MSVSCLCLAQPCPIGIDAPGIDTQSIADILVSSNINAILEAKKFVIRHSDTKNLVTYFGCGTHNILNCTEQEITFAFSALIQLVGHPVCKILRSEMLACLSVWSKVQMIMCSYAIISASLNGVAM